MARLINCAAFAFYYYAVTYIIIINVIWTEGVSEINYWIELNLLSNILLTSYIRIETLTV